MEEFNSSYRTVFGDRWDALGQLMIESIEELYGSCADAFIKDQDYYKFRNGWLPIKSSPSKEDDAASSSSSSSAAGEEDHGGGVPGEQFLTTGRAALKARRRKLETKKTAKEPETTSSRRRKKPHHSSIKCDSSGAAACSTADEPEEIPCKRRKKALSSDPYPRPSATKIRTPSSSAPNSVESAPHTFNDLAVDGSVSICSTETTTVNKGNNIIDGSVSSMY